MTTIAYLAVSEDGQGAPNEIVVEVSELNFEVRVEGFDTHRDLQIKATR